MLAVEYQRIFRRYPGIFEAGPDAVKGDMHCPWDMVPIVFTLGADIDDQGGYSILHLFQEVIAGDARRAACNDKKAESRNPYDGILDKLHPKKKNR